MIVGSLVAGCSGPVLVAGTPGPAGTPSPQAPAADDIQGAGGTLAAPLYAQWIKDYSAAAGVGISYQAVGSGNGIMQITAHVTDFGGSDAILTPQQLAAAPGLQMIPTVAGTVVIIYNLSGLGAKPTLLLDGATLSRIFLGQIHRWNDPALAALNSSSKLPDQDIVVVHRSDSSGTTFIFTDYLQAVSPAWRKSVGRTTSPTWPTGVGAKGSDGVLARVLASPGSIGYIELSYALANHTQSADMVNSAGARVEPSLASTQSAMSDFALQMPETLATSIVNAPGAGSWPIAGYTYVLIYQDQSNCDKAARMLAFFRWALTAGSRTATDLGYGPLPDSVRARVFAKLDTITCHGQPLAH
jgi:phosphate transport system substrate-binding protein